MNELVFELGTGGDFFLTSTQYPESTRVRTPIINQKPTIMNSIQSDRHNMHLKTESFLTDHAAETAGQPLVGTYLGVLSDRITKVIEADGIATADTTGTTAAKDAKRTDLINKALHVIDGAKAHAMVTEDTELMDLIDYTESDLKRMRDSDLQLKMSHVYDATAPIAASLVTYGVSAGDLTALDDAVEAFRVIIPKPSTKTDQKVVAGHDVDEYQAELTTLLTKKLDIVMNLFRTSNPNLHEGYYLARAIDDTNGPSGPWVHINTVPAAGGVDTVTFSKPASAGLKLENTGSADLSFQLANASGAIGAAVTVLAGQTWTGTLVDLGNGGDRFKVSNLDAVSAGSFRITVG